MLTQQKQVHIEAVVGVDIEASDKSYEGYICLIQISYFSSTDNIIKTFVFDILTIFHGIDDEMR